MNKPLQCTFVVTGNVPPKRKHKERCAISGDAGLEALTEFKEKLIDIDVGVLESVANNISDNGPRTELSELINAYVTATNLRRASKYLNQHEGEYHGISPEKLIADGALPDDFKLNKKKLRKFLTGDTYDSREPYRNNLWHAFNNLSRFIIENAGGVKSAMLSTLNGWEYDDVVHTRKNRTNLEFLQDSLVGVYSIELQCKACDALRAAARDRENREAGF